MKVTLITWHHDPTICPAMQPSLMTQLRPYPATDLEKSSSVNHLQSKAAGFTGILCGRSVRDFHQLYCCKTARKLAPVSNTEIQGEFLLRLDLAIGIIRLSIPEGGGGMCLLI